ncbi:MAG: hypothetical protein LBF06_25785 [Pseudomonas sp.]|jgi:hypothetical protein|nr:hypothetical protein [Pseudomonas sp.]
MYVVSLTGVIAALGVVVSLGAVAEDRVPEPNDANCSGETYEQILASLCKEWAAMSSSRTARASMQPER